MGIDLPGRPANHVQSRFAVAPDSRNQKAFLLALSGLDFGLFCSASLWQRGHQVSCVVQVWELRSGCF